MIKAAHLIVKNILKLGKFNSSQIPKRVYSELLTAFTNYKNKDIIVIPQFIHKYCRSGGNLIVDETVIEKYGLKHIVRKLKILNNGGYCMGYKIVLFIWNKESLRIPIGFALYHKESDSVNELTLKFISKLRNEFKIKPDMFLADGAYCVNKLMKRLTDYNWAFMIRFKSNRKLSGRPIKKLIARGYGNAKGYLKNGTKIKVFRRKERFYASNRMLLDMQQAVKYYIKRWKVEETFRVLKSCVGIKRCQQHRTISQEIFIWMCLIAFTYLETFSNNSIYKTFNDVIFDKQKVDINHFKDILTMC